MSVRAIHKNERQVLEKQMAKGKDISMRQLRYFVAAADAGQFSQAALKVHVSQSAITAAVLQLEETLGVSLFERLPYGVALTAEGHKFAQHARHILDTLQDALSEPLFLSHGMQGEVRVGASYTVLGYFLPALLALANPGSPTVAVLIMAVILFGFQTAIGNVQTLPSDFYSGIIMRALGIPVDMFTVMFAIGRMPGWIANWKEIAENPKSRIHRPRQIYTGEALRDYVKIGDR